MRIEILGPAQVRHDDGSVVRIPGARMSAVLVRLAVAAGRAVSPGALAEAVWPDGGPGDPAHALQALVSRLRSLLPATVPVRAVSRGYLLDVPPDSVDVYQFERLADDGRRALHAGAHDRAEALLGAALALWRADPFPDVREAAVAAQAARLAEIHVSVVEDRLAAQLPRRGGELIAEAEALAAAYPLRERPHALLIDALRLGGRNAEALTAYERIRRRLADELGTDPGLELRRAHLAALQADSGRPTGTVTAPLTSLIGREAEQSQIRARLDSGRLVTLVGPGGVGKTRLALTVAGQLREPGGVWLVELAAVAEPVELVHAVVAALDLRETGMRYRDPVHRLTEALRARPAVLVLDNCEHLVDTVARLAQDLLVHCPSLRILATSREPLGIAGELLVPVLPLPTAAAVRLFAERAQAVRPGFAIDADNADQVGDVCRRLDGLPLAIELCAARLRTMPLATVLARLDDRFALLSAGNRTALPRHQTLAAVMAWSWDLLGDEERTAAQRLAVFRGGFTAEAAQRIGTRPDSLVDRSLLQFDGERYRMLETVREYALTSGADAGAARSEHAAYFLDLAVRAAPRLRGADQVSWLSRLNPERDNFTAALDHACAVGDADTAVRLAVALGQFWAIHGEHGFAADRLLAALRVPGAAAPEDRAAASAAYLFHAVLAGDSARARSVIDVLHTADPLARALLALVDGDAAGVRTALEEEPADPWKRGMFGLVRSFADFNDGDFPAARDDLRAAAAGFREAGDRWGLSTALTYLAVADVSGHDIEDGTRAIADAVTVAGELGGNAYQRLWSAIIGISAGERDAARRELVEIVDEVSGVPAAMAAVTLADLARHTGDFTQAQRWLDRAGSGADRDDLMVRAMLSAGRGHLALDRGAVEEADDQLTRALALGQEAGDMGVVAMAGVGLAELRWRRADPEGAAELLGATARWGSVAANLDAARLERELRAALGEAGYAGAHRHGRDLDRAGALALMAAQVRRR